MINRRLISASESGTCWIGSLRDDELIIERKGKPLAALVSIKRLEQMRRFARRRAIEFIEQQEPSAFG